MSINVDQVRWVSHLARLKLNDAELNLMARQLSAIIDYVDQLQAVDTTDIEPMAHPLPIVNVFRPDVLAAGLSVDEALANAPDRAGDFFGVPAILE